MKKPITICILVLLLASLSVAGYGIWRQYHNATYIQINDTWYPRSSTSLDLNGQALPESAHLSQLGCLRRLDLRNTGLTPEDYDFLCAALPECSILWNIPFQGSYYDSTTSSLTITSITAEELDTLAYFHNLSTVDATQCPNPDMVLALQERYPQCRIGWNMRVGGKSYTKSATSIEAENVNVAELELAMRYLPNLASIHLTGTLPPIDWLLEARQSHPQLRIRWDYSLFGEAYPDDTRELDLSGIPMEDTRAVEASLPYFPQLEKVIMSDCGIESPDMDALNQRYDNIRFVWTIYVGRCNIRTDATVFMPFKWGYTPGYPLRKDEFGELKYCTDLICMDLGHMEVDDCSFLNYMPNMQYLLMADTDISDITPVGNLKELVYLELFLTKISDISPLANCKKLQDVNLCFTYFENLEVLAQLPDLQHVWLIATYQPADQLTKVLNAHPDTHFCLYANGSSTGFGWRETENYYRQRDLLGMVYMKD